MEKFDFLIGNWKLKYTVPKSSFSGPDTGEGTGTFSRALNDTYVFFDYEATLTSGSAQAHGIFARVDKQNNYKYWWFEDSGVYLMATCRFIDDRILFMNWHDTLLIQTFEMVGKNYVVLKMSQAQDINKFELILKVEFIR